MTTIAPRTSSARSALLIDLDSCVGCHACSVACKSGSTTAPFGDEVWPNQVFSYELDNGAAGRTLHVPRMCQHCETPDCVSVCPTGASYRRAADGVVLVDESLCVGCRLCAWACPYGARKYDEQAGVIRKCTLCCERREANGGGLPACVSACPTGARHFGDLADPDSAVSVLVRSRGGFALQADAGSVPAVHYLPPRAPLAVDAPTPVHRADGARYWADRLLSR